MYNNHFGFSESPFSITPDPRFFYSNPVYQEAYANLCYGIEKKKGFIVITGEAGTGKSTLLRRLMRNLGDTIHCAYIFNTDLTFPELLRVALHDLGLSPQETNKVSMLQELNNHLLGQLKQGHIVSVLVDEAQNLSADTLEGLRLLSNLETDQEKLLQIVLMGQPELERKLDQPTLRQLKQRISVQCRLEPLQEKEVGPYIDFRLRAVGYEGKGLFRREAVHQIAFYSKGIPRLMNIICDNALLNAYASSQDTVSADIISEVARDLRLTPQVQTNEAATSPKISASSADPEIPTDKAASDVPRHNVRRIAKAGIEGVVVMLFFLAVASAIDPRNIGTIAGRGFQVAKHNLNQWVVLFTQQAAVPKRVDAGEKSKSREPQRIVVLPGSSIYKIVNDTYKENGALGMDLIQEFNPEIKNLSKVAAGQDLLLPFLTPETLIRKQPDDSYRLIVASFHSRRAADEHARILSSKGYHVLITLRKISNTLSVYRVEIAGLQNLEEANRMWETGVRDEWITLAGNPGRQRPGG
jgi:general secretion pathway protein A